MSLKKYHTVTYQYVVHKEQSHTLTVPNGDPAQLVLGPVTMQHDVECDQYPWQPGSSEGQQSEEAESHVRIPSAPDVYQCRTEGSAQERLAEERRDRQ